MMLYPQAKQYLMGRGMTAEQVAAIPVPQALGQFVLGEYQSGFDELVKWSAVPYWQAQAGIAAVERDAEQRAMNTPAQWFLSAAPSMARAIQTQATLDRQVAALQTVEALRNYAATHGGKLPASLDEITDTPAPLNPMTGKPFAYRVEGNVATLDSPATDGVNGPAGCKLK